ncbi:MAG TPA: choice-of-anchor Q domain-containing protein, partial [Phototrophicaceae bacterium]|nr:choice-of-anchor Q domain-containing protein [Phototrophicaceae bacterium]
MRFSRYSLTTLLLSTAAFLLIVMSVSGNSARAEYTVDTTADTLDNIPGDGTCADSDGFCSLRAAITEANTTTDLDVILLPPGTYTLTLEGAGDDVNLSGDLDITTAIVLQGTDVASTTFIDGNDLEGSLDIHTSSEDVVNITVNNITFTGNTQPPQVGVKISGNIVASLNNIVLDGNYQGASIGAGSTVTMTSSVVTGNHAFGEGGGIVNFGDLSAFGGIFVNNSAATGGAIANHGALNILGAFFAGNSAGSTGGALYISGESGIVSMRDTTFTGNTALFGGAMLNTGTDTAAFNSTFYGNTATNSGGAILSTVFFLMKNSTISDNTVTAEDGTGGGIALADGSWFSVNNVTISSNTAATGGGVYIAPGEGTTSAFILDTIIAGNSATVGADCSDSEFEIESGGFNLIGNTSACTDFIAEGDLTNLDAGLAPLDDNGGPTKTRALLDGSPAINAGDSDHCMEQDQRYVDRVGRCDIGAYEYDTPEVPTETPTSTPDPGTSTELLVNGGFETIGGNGKPDVAPWTVSNSTGDKVKCNTGDKIFSNTGNCAFRFKGVTGENAKLSQVVTPDITSLAGETVSLSAFTKAS